MPIIQQNNTFQKIYSNNNIHIYCKKALYHSTFNKNYNTVIELKIYKNNQLYYSINNLHFPIDVNGLQNIKDYLEDIVLFIQYSKYDQWQQQQILDQLLLDLKTINFKIIIKNVKREIQKEKEQQEYNKKNKKLVELKQQIRNKYNKLDYAVIYNLHNLFIIKNKKLINNQNDKYWDNLLCNDKLLQDFINRFNKEIVYYCTLNWSKRDIPILNKILK